MSKNKIRDAESEPAPTEKASHIAPARTSFSPAELRTTLVTLFKSPDYKPPVLPSVALELTSLARQTTVSYEALVRVLERDPLLAASVVNLAQSPLYGGRARLTSLKDALNRLGLTTLRDIAWQVVVNVRLFRVSTYSFLMERLQRHSTFVAYAARIIARHTGVGTEYAFLCGLLHDIGWSGALVVLAERFPQLVTNDSLFIGIDRMHAEAAESMATLWGLAPEIIEVIGHHHDVENPKKPAHPLVPVLCVAEHWGDELGFALERPDSAVPPLGLDENIVGRYEQAIETLQLKSKLAQIREEVEQTAERLRSAEA